LISPKNQSPPAVILPVGVRGANPLDPLVNKKGNYLAEIKSVMVQRTHGQEEKRTAKDISSMISVKNIIYESSLAYDMVRTLRSDDEWKLALLNELSRIATSLEEIQATQEFSLQTQEAKLRLKLQLLHEESE